MRYKLRENKDQLRFTFGSKKSWKNNGLLLLFLLVVLFLSGRAAYKVYLNVRESSRAAGEKQSELTQLQAREKFLNQEFKNMSSPDGLEAKFREKFGVGRPGENVAIIVEGTPTNSASSTTGFWRAIKDFFK